MALTTTQSKVKQITRVRIIGGDTLGMLETDANNFIATLEATGVNYAVNVGDPVPGVAVNYLLRITYISIEYLTEEATGL